MTTVVPPAPDPGGVERDSVAPSARENGRAVASPGPRPTRAPQDWGDGGPGRRLTTQRRLLPAIVAAQVLLAVAGLLVWRLLPDAPAVPPVPPPDPTVTEPATLESGLALAERQAAAWLPGARLMSASMQVDWPWDPPARPPRRVPGTGWLTYVFVAPWQAPGRSPGAATLSIVIERLSGQIVAQSVLPWQTAPPMPAPGPKPAVSSSEAVLAAERFGGTAFRRACPAERHLSRVSLVSGNGWPPHWLVTYEDARTPAANALLVRVDAASGALLQSERDAPPCGEEETPAVVGSAARRPREDG